MKFLTTSKISENIRKTPEGYLVCLAVPIARTGTMDYAPGETPISPGPDGIVKINRTEDQVFRPETIASFEGKPITISHPATFVKPENWSELTHGIVQNVRRGVNETSNDLVADLLITSAEAIALINAGLREVSCGYHATWVETGVGQGVQENIIGNHLALVDEGRAGSDYAINDQKRKGSVMTVTEKIKAIFGKAEGDALKLVAEAKDDLSEMSSMATATPAGYDEVMKAVKDLDTKLSSLMPKPKDASTQPTENTPAKVVAEDEPVAPSIEERMKKLEDAVARLMEKLSVGDAEGEEGAETAEDADEAEEEAEEEEVVDEESEEEMVGDAASRIEILAPGQRFTGKDAKAKALKYAFETRDGKAAIEVLTGGANPDFKDEKVVNILFRGASEFLKEQRATAFSVARTRVTDTTTKKAKSPITPEELNALNAQHYGTAK